MYLNFQLVESIFSFKKILNALQKVFADDLAILSNKLIFINICTFDGLEILENLSKLQFFEHIVYQILYLILIEKCS